MARRYKIKNAHIGHCAYCSKEIWRSEPGWVVMPRDAIYKDYLCHTINPKTDCFNLYSQTQEKTENVIIK